MDFTQTRKAISYSGFWRKFMINNISNIPDAWREFVPLLKNNQHLAVLQNIDSLREKGTIIYPSQDNIFHALDYVEPQQVKVIILGQDPYHNEGQAHGLAFSVLNDIACPPSLKNIFKEISQDIYGTPLEKQNLPSSNLARLASQGVLLLNTILSVEQNSPLSHANLGWQKITTNILTSLASNTFLEGKTKPLVILLWGNYAKKYASIFDKYNIHYILQASHPSPLSATRGFLGCKHFSKANAWLKAHHQEPIIW